MYTRHRLEPRLIWVSVKDYIYMPFAWMWGLLSWKCPQVLRYDRQLPQYHCNRWHWNETTFRVYDDVLSVVEQECDTVDPHSTLDHAPQVELVTLEAICLGVPGKMAQCRTLQLCWGQLKNLLLLYCQGSSQKLENSLLQSQSTLESHSLIRAPFVCSTILLLTTLRH